MIPTFALRRDDKTNTPSTSPLSWPCQTATAASTPDWPRATQPVSLLRALRSTLLPLIVKEPGSWSWSFSRSAATRAQVVRHSFCVMWVAASQSLKQVVSQNATRSFISWMSLADLDGCGLGLIGCATDLEKAYSAARQTTRTQTTRRMKLCPLDRRIGAVGGLRRG